MALAGRTNLVIFSFPNSTPPSRVEIGEADRSISVTPVNLLRLEAGVRVEPKLVPAT